MTTNKARRYTLALLLILLLAVGCDSQSAMVDPDPTVVSAEAFMIRSSQVAVSPTTSEGTFKGFGAIDDNGAYTEVLNSAEPLHMLTSLHGKKTLKGTQGTIEIEFYVDLDDTGHNTIQAKGSFHIVGGSGAYARLQGEGEIDLELDEDASPADLTDFLEGKARYAQ